MERKKKSKMNILKTFILFLLMGNAFAQVKSPCVTKFQNLDFACRCKKTNTCMKSLSKSEQKQIANQKNATTTKYFKRFTKDALPLYKLMNQTFKGEVDLQKFPYKKLAKTEKTMDKYLKKLKPKLEKTLKKMGAKTYKLEERTKRYMDQKMKKIPKRVKVALEKSSVKFTPRGTAGSLASTGKSSKKVNGSQDGNLQVENNKVAVKSTTKNGITNVDATAAADSLKRNKKYKVNDIHGSHKEIWVVLSYRYNLVKSRLDQKAIAAGSFGNEEIESIKKSVLRKLKLL
jgi:hypothetical protein